MMPVLKLAFGGAAILSVMVIAASERDPPRPRILATDPVTARWPDDPPTLPKADRLPLAQAADDFPAEKVELVAPPPLPPANAAEPRRHHPQTEPKKLTRPRDACSRHGLHKVVTRGGRSWRCRR